MRIEKSRKMKGRRRQMQFSREGEVLGKERGRRWSWIDILISQHQGMAACDWVVKDCGIH